MTMEIELLYDYMKTCEQNKHPQGQQTIEFKWVYIKLKEAMIIEEENIYKTTLS